VRVGGCGRWRYDGRVRVLCWDLICSMRLLLRIYVGFEIVVWNLFFLFWEVGMLVLRYFSALVC